MYNVTGINQIFWQYAKSNYSYNDFDDLKSQLTKLWQDYIGMDLYPLSERELVEAACNTFADYVYNVRVPKHLTNSVFKMIYGDSVIDLVYGKDNRPLEEKIIIGIIVALRNTQIYTTDNECLINYGQILEK